VVDVTLGELRDSGMVRECHLLCQKLQWNSASYYQKHRLEIIAKQTKYNQEHREQFNEYHKKYQQELRAKKKLEKQ
jgi:hypothetical protein